MNENLFFINTYEDFLLGNLENLSIDKNIGTGAIVLSSNNNKYIEYGIYTSQVINLKTFKRLLVSWNCETPKGTWIEIQARAFISYYDDNENSTYEWSDWLSFGKWGTHIKRSSKSPDSHLAKISTDEFIIKGSYTDTASKIQIRALLHTENTNVTPSIRQFIISYKDNTPRIKGIEIPSNKIIDVPSYSQYIRDKNIGSVICSPTSITMLLNRRNENLIVEETAWSCFDYDYEAFGNWLFNVAFASSLGYESFVEYGNLKSLKREIYSEYPVAVSVKYTNDINNLEYPYIENAPITTAGNILVVRGFEKKDDIDYVEDREELTEERIKDMLDAREYKELKEELETNMYPVDLAEILEEFDQKHMVLVFRLLAKEEAAETFSYMNRYARRPDQCTDGFRTGRDHGGNVSG